MIHLVTKDYIEIALGFAFMWIGVYILSKDPFKKLSWLIFAVIMSFGFTIFTDSLLLQTQNIHQYTVWQKITDWPLFIAPIFYYHISLYTKKEIKKWETIALIIGYFGAISFFLIDIHGGLILRENMVRMQNYRRIDGFEPGILLQPSIAFVSLFVLFGVCNFFQEIKKSFWKYFLPALSGIFLLMTAVTIAFSYEIYMNLADTAYSIGVSISLLLFIYSIVKYYLFVSTTRLLDKVFFIKTLVVVVITSIYFAAFVASGVELNFSVYVLLILTMLLVILTHTLYDWISTFVNDLLYNVKSGLSIVTDEEVNFALKNLNDYEKLENSTLLRLGLVDRLMKVKNLTPIDALREVIGESVEYFNSNESQRVKKALKYQILKMIAHNEAEEGQILWELGFEEYPVKILTQENKTRGPLFQITAPSDYSYKSRNAYLALKKEAIHDVVWRISYLEKQVSKR